MVGDFTALRDRLAGSLDGVDGWLHPAEAAVLYRAAYAAAKAGQPTLAEIGSWKGRSAIAMGKALLDAGAAGTLYAIDPHEVRWAGDEDRLPALRENLARAGVIDAVTIVQERSHDARSRFSDASLDLLFIDGDHSYAGVRLDIEDWTSALRPNAFVGFNDYQIPDVARALRHLVLRPRSPFRRPRWMVSSLFFDYRPDQRWTVSDTVRLWRARAFVRLGSTWIPRYNRLQESQRASRQRLRSTATWVHMKIVYPTCRIMLPTAD